MNTIAPSQRHDTFPDERKQGPPEGLAAVDPSYA
jgi:hypothetical protein